MIKRVFLIFLYLTIGILESRAQSEVQIQVGSILELAPTDSASYQYIDLYTKTRFETAEVSQDSISSAGLYNYFFSRGDFDAYRLPATMQGQQLRIAAFQNVEDKEGNIRTIILCWFQQNKSMIWIEMNAFDAGEVYLLQ